MLEIQNDKETVFCPIKEVNVYRWVCLEKCSYHKKKKCPLEKNDEKS